jgi:hypothetical protein
MNSKWSLKYLLSDTNLIRDIKSIISFLLAYAVAVVSNGLIEDFSPQLLWSVTVGLGAAGTYFAIRIITSEFTDRGMYDEEESNADLKTRLDIQKKLSADVKTEFAYDYLVTYNEQKIGYLKKVRYEELKSKYTVEIKRLEALIEHTKLTKKIKWFNGFTKWYINKLNARKRNVGRKLANLSMNDIRVKYHPVSLNQLRVAYSQEDENSITTSERFDITPQNKIRKQMAVSSFIKTFLLVSFQGAAIATISSWTAFGIFLIFITFTLSTTALFAYVGVRRYASMNYIPILDEKNQLLDKIIKETKHKTAETLEDLFKNQQSIDEFYQI